MLTNTTPVCNLLLSSFHTFTSQSPAPAPLTPDGPHTPSRPPLPSPPPPRPRPRHAHATPHAAKPRRSPRSPPSSLSSSRSRRTAARARMKMASCPASVTSGSALTKAFTRARGSLERRAPGAFVGAWGCGAAASPLGPSSSRGVPLPVAAAAIRAPSLLRVAAGCARACGAGPFPSAGWRPRPLWPRSHAPHSAGLAGESGRVGNRVRRRVFVGASAPPRHRL